MGLRAVRQMLSHESAHRISVMDDEVIVIQRVTARDGSRVLEVAVCSSPAVASDVCEEEAERRIAVEIREPMEVG